MAMADSFQVQSYYYREMYTVVYLLASLWPVAYGFRFLWENLALALTWTICCIAMSVFTLLPALKIESSNLM